MSASLLKRLVVGCLTAAALAATQPAFAFPTLAKGPDAVRPAVPEARLSPKQLNEIGTRGACWILHWHNGLNHSGHGSGWVLDARKRLIVTNEHMVHDKDVVEVFFPIWEGDRPKPRLPALPAQGKGRAGCRHRPRPGPPASG